VLILRINERDNKIHIQRVEKQNGQWVIVGRKSIARLSRFDGSYWNYGFVEHKDLIRFRQPVQEAAE
jgi:hypothetical protein